MNNNWKPGEIAICKKIGNLYNINGNLPNLRLNAEYIVNNVFICECGKTKLDVGLTLISNSRGTLCQCGACTSPKTGIHWCAAERFVKKDMKSIEDKIAEAVSVENYELADQLLKNK